MKKIVLTTIYMVLFAWAGLAQSIKFSEKPEEFVGQVSQMLKPSKDAPSSPVAFELQTLWSTSTLTPDQKQKIIALSNQMVQKKYRVKPDIESFWAMINAAVNLKKITAERLDQLLKVSQRAIDTYTNPQQGVVFFNNAKLFCERDAIFTNGVYFLKVKTADFIFEFADEKIAREEAEAAKKAPEPEKQPEKQPEEPKPATTKSKKNKPKKDAFNSWPSDWGTEPTPDPTAEQAQPAFSAFSTAESYERTIPSLEGLLITFKNADLVFAIGNEDSSALVGTNGSLMVETGTFVGEGGRFDWSNAGLDPKKVYVDVKKYALNIKSQDLFAENARLTHEMMLEKPIEGIFEYKSQRKVSPETAQYPKFKSYQPNAIYKDLGPNILVYRGGFSLTGQKVSSASAYGGNSIVKIKQDKKINLQGIANSFEISDTAVVAESAYSAIYLAEGDSIVQPGSRFVYKDKKKELRLYKERGYYKDAPFVDSYHKIEINSQVLKYSIDTAKIEFYMLTAKDKLPTIIESIEYFTTDRFTEVQSIFNFHPVFVVMKYYNKTNQETFNVADIAQMQKLEISGVKSAMLTIASQGYIDYDPNSGNIRLKDKIKHFYTSKLRQKDWDYMTVISIAPPRSNAILDLKTNEMLVMGVDKFYLNDSMSVYISPKNRELKIHKNRKLTFDGKIAAGRYISYGTDFSFDYEKYIVNLANIDSIGLQLDIKSKRNSKRARRSVAKLENRNKTEGGVTDISKLSSGVIYLNRPDNKSMRVKLPKYPIFDIISNIFIYFDSAAKGAYDNRVHFRVPPFKADSISNFNPGAISYEGTFVPGGIFPEFKERLTIMKDNTLGFVHKVPKDGYPMYESDAVFYGELSMNKKGLKGKGEIRYLTSVIKSDDFMFYQDSVTTQGTIFAMKGENLGRGSFPQMKFENFMFKWIPAKDSMIVRNTENNPLRFYNKYAQLEGQIVVSEAGVTGEGTLKSEGAQVKSKRFNFMTDKVTGRESLFEVQSDNPDKPSMISKNVKFDFNIKDKYAEFNPEKEGVACNEFPNAQYKTSIPKAVWNVDKKIVTMSMPAGSNIADSYFYSTDPAQDSLNFNATEAIYDIARNRLNISGVPFVRVADAKILPHENKLLILENALMEDLSKAVIIVDTLDQYHRLIDGNIKIISRKSFSGAAIYQYVNSAKDTMLIRFDDFSNVTQRSGILKMKQLVHTVSGGTVQEDKPLKITPGMLYKGRVTMYANRPSLEFDGYLKLDVKKYPDADWLKFNSTGENKETIVKLKDTEKLTQKTVYSGLFMQDGSLNLYSTMVATKKTPADKDIFLATGMLKYDEKQKEFKVYPEDKDENSLDGNVFTYNDSTYRITYRGRFEIAGPIDKNFEVVAYGIGNCNLDTNNYTLNSLLRVNCPTIAKSWRIMGEDFANKANDITAKEANPDPQILIYKLANLVGSKNAEKHITDALSHPVPLIKTAPTLTGGLVLSDLNLKWSEKENSWYSEGTIGISNAGKQEINARINGFVEIKYAATGSVTNIYLEPTEGTWYFFSYNDNKRLAVLSSNSSYNKAISVKAKSPDQAKSGIFHFEMADISEKNAFLVNFNEVYMGKKIDIKEPESPVPSGIEAQPVPAGSDAQAQPAAVPAEPVAAPSTPAPIEPPVAPTTPASAEPGAVPPAPEAPATAPVAPVANPAEAPAPTPDQPKKEEPNTGGGF